MGCSPSGTFRSPIAPTGVLVAANGRQSKAGTITELQHAFSAVEKKVIIKNWKYLANDLTGRGTRVFFTLFDENPHLKKLFPFENLEGEELVKSHSFKGHASRFMQAVGAVVDNLDSCDEALTPLLLDLGRNHLRYSGFKPDYFNYFEAAMMSVWAEDLGPKFNQPARAAWARIFQFIQLKLQEGYAQGHVD